MSNMLKSISLLLPEHKRHGFSVTGYYTVTKVEFLTKFVATCKGERVTASELIGLLPHFLKGPALLAIKSRNPSSWEEAVTILLKPGKGGKEIADTQKKFFRFWQKDDQSTESHLTELNQAVLAADRSLSEETKMHYFVQNLHPMLAGQVNAYWENFPQSSWSDWTNRALTLGDPHLTRSGWKGQCIEIDMSLIGSVPLCLVWVFIVCFEVFSEPEVEHVGGWLSPSKLLKPAHVHMR